MCQIPDRMSGFRIDDYEPREREGGERHGRKEGVLYFLEDLRFSTRDSANVFDWRCQDKRPGGSILLRCRLKVLPWPC